MNRQILEEATAWFVDFRAAELDTQARQRFTQWLRLSPEHIRAYMDIAGVYAQLPTAEVMEPADIDRLIEKTRSRPGGDNVQALAPARIGRVAREARGSPAPWTIAAGVAIVGAALAVTAIALKHSPVYATAIGEQRALTLQDGSRIELNGRSKVRVNFTEDARELELIEGQALFDVARDAHRPFRVRSNDVLVRALGTRFDVDRKTSGTKVTVLEGKVAVASIGQEAGSDREVFLSAGEQTVVKHAAIGRPRPANAVSATAWTQHQLEFDETPLADVVEELNRHNAKTLIIDSAALENFRITGVYSSSDPASLIRFLRSQPGVSVVETKQEIRIGQR